MLFQKSTKSFVSALLVALALQSPLSLAGVDAFELNHATSLSDFKGRTFLEAMLEEETGLKAMIDADGVEKFKVADTERMADMVQYFEPGVYRQIIRIFKKGETGLYDLVNGLAGRSVTPISIVGAIAGELQELELVKDPLKIGLNAVQIAPFLTLVSGGGTVVHIDDNNHYYNVNYKPGSDDEVVLAKHVKSGRSFGVAPGHAALDSSDVEYLTALEEYLDETQDTTLFYDTLLRTLIQCDTSGFAKLSDKGQDVSTDFVTVYTAELDRYAMTGLSKHPWMNDLAEVTFLSAFGARANVIRYQGGLVEGTAKDYFGVGTGGTGIGITRKDRRALQVMVAKFMRANEPAIVDQVEALIGTSRDGDVVHNFMIYLNEPANQADIRKNAKKLTQAMAKYLGTVSRRAGEIREQILQ